MQNQANSISTFIQDREIEYLLKNVKIKTKQNLPSINLDSIKISETKQGNIIEVPRWAAEVFTENGFCEIQEESFEVEMLKALSRERIQGPNQISTLNANFYLKLKRYLNQLKKDKQSNNNSTHDYEEANIKAMDILKLRTVKFLPLTVGEVTPELMQKITPEEANLFNIVRDVVQRWKNNVLEGTENE